jgi:hypothetical protein
MASCSTANESVILWPAGWPVPVSRSPRVGKRITTVLSCLYDNWWNPNVSGISGIGCSVAAGSLAAISKAPSQTDMFFRTTGGCLYDTWWNPSVSGITKVVCNVAPGTVVTVSKA